MNSELYAKLFTYKKIIVNNYAGELDTDDTSTNIEKYVANIKKNNNITIEEKDDTIETITISVPYDRKLTVKVTRNDITIRGDHVGSHEEVHVEDSELASKILELFVS